MKEKIIEMSYEEGLKKGETDWDAVNALTEEDIQRAIAEDPDAFEITDEMFARAKLIIPKKRVSVHMHLDDDVLAFFKEESGSHDHLVLMNIILRRYMEFLKRERESSTKEKA